MVIYLDLILLINFIFNFMLLLLTKHLTKMAVPLYRLFIGSIVATAFIPLVLYFPESLFHSTIVKGLYSVFIMVVTLVLKEFINVDKRCLCFILYAFAVGGGLFAAHFLLESSYRRIFIKF